MEWAARTCASGQGCLFLTIAKASPAGQPWKPHLGITIIIIIIQPLPTPLPTHTRSNHTYISHLLRLGPATTFTSDSGSLAFSSAAPCPSCHLSRVSSPIAALEQCSVSSPLGRSVDPRHPPVPVSQIGAAFEPCQYQRLWTAQNTAPQQPIEPKLPLCSLPSTYLYCTRRSQSPNHFLRCPNLEPAIPSSRKLLVVVPVGVYSPRPQAQTVSLCESGPSSLRLPPLLL